jgi:hypothetical protein
MPYNFDFSKVENVKTIEVHPVGWVSPLYIEYGIYNGPETGEVVSYHWRIKGTQHTFVIPTLRMDFLSSGDYIKHYEKTLEVFRQDYIEWKEQKFINEWAREYERQFSKFIVI